MAVIVIISFTTSSPTDRALSKLSQGLQIPDERSQFVIGTKAQDPSTIQITSEWPSIQAPSDLTNSPAYQAFVEKISSFISSPLAITVAVLDKSIFATGSPPLIEYVHSSFPSSSTPEFRSKIEEDFARFEAIYRRRGASDDVGETGLAIGWAEEKDGFTGFVVVRGWTSMDRFEESVQSEEFKEGIPILMGWGAPFELWHVERKGGSEGLKDY